MAVCRGADQNRFRITAKQLLNRCKFADIVSPRKLRSPLRIIVVDAHDLSQSQRRFRITGSMNMPDSQNRHFH